MDYSVQLSRYFVSYFLEYGRYFSFRVERTPYKIYLSEILLQRTRAKQVEPVFINLIDKFNDIHSLLTGFSEVQDIMASLGRFCRFGHIYNGLTYLAEKHDGNIPFQKDALLAVPSIGPYIAAAIRIFGFNIPDVIIDSNVVRVLGRVYGLKVTPETRRSKEFITLAVRHLPDKQFVEYSYGILDFAAQVCRVSTPGCGICGLVRYCSYCENNLKPYRLHSIN